MMSFKTAVVTCFKKYFTISGRATRAEFWWFHLLFDLASVVVFLLSIALDDTVWIEVSIGIYCLFLVATIIPGFCVLVRRLHDAGYSGLNILWSLIPYVGSFIVFILAIQASVETNVYGPKPLEDGSSPSPSTSAMSSDKSENVVRTEDVDL